MINKNLIKLMKQLQDNSKYLGKIKGIKDSQKLYDYCSSIVGGYSKEEFDNFAKHLVGTNKELQALSDDNLAAVSGGTIGEWLKSKMPTMPRDSGEFRSKVKSVPFTVLNLDTGTTETTYVGGEWTNNISRATGILGRGSSMIKMFEIIYFDDLDTIPPEEIANFLLDLTGQA